MLYVNPSPWYLQWANSVWIQCVHDQKDASFGTTKMNKITYRDACYYDFLKNHRFQFRFRICTTMIRFTEKKEQE